MGGFPAPAGQLPRGCLLKSHLGWLSGVLTSAPSLSTAGLGDPVWMVMPQIPMVPASFLYLTLSLGIGTASAREVASCFLSRKMTPAGTQINKCWLAFSLVDFVQCSACTVSPGGPDDLLSMEEGP